MEQFEIKFVENYSILNEIKKCNNIDCTIFKMHSDKGQRKYSLTLEVSCYKYLKKARWHVYSLC